MVEEKRIKGTTLTVSFHDMLVVNGDIQQL